MSLLHIRYEAVVFLQIELKTVVITIIIIAYDMCDLLTILLVYWLKLVALVNKI